MSDLEIMERGCTYTNYAYISAYGNKMSPSELDYNATMYSASCLYSVLYSEDGLCNNYTRNDNLGFQMAGLGKDSIRNELLKSIVKVGMYHRLNDTIAGNQLGSTITPGMNTDQISVTIMNAMINEGVEKGYEMLNDPNTLYSACQTFAYYMGSTERKNDVERITSNNNVTLYLNNELDTFYARYGDGYNETNVEFGGK